MVYRAGQIDGWITDRPRADDNNEDDDVGNRPSRSSVSRPAALVLASRPPTCSPLGDGHQMGLDPGTRGEKTSGSDLDRYPQSTAWSPPVPLDLSRSP